MKVKTHKNASSRLLGTPIYIEDDTEAVVELEACAEMSVDDKGLVHGGFTFGLADYAAMLAFNSPYVVLRSAECRFLAPVRVGDIMRAKAVVTSRDKKRRSIEVEILVGDVKVLKGVYSCYVLDRHVLDRGYKAQKLA